MWVWCPFNKFGLHLSKLNLHKCKNLQMFDSKLRFFKKIREKLFIGSKANILTHYNMF